MEQRTKEWYAIRVGKVGGSESVGVTTTARLGTLIWLKLGELLTGEQKEVKVTEAMQRGIDLEPIARQTYEEAELEDVKEVGYITNIHYKYAGLSPDGLSSSTVGLEIKCPDSKLHVETCVTNEVPKKHRPQIAWMFMMLPELEFVDYVSYDDRVKKRPYHCVRVDRFSFNSDIKKAIDGYIKFENKINEYLKHF
ncbi:MAG: YqaJ viral recombinase family protein [Bacteroidota bacterium]